MPHIDLAIIIVGGLLIISGLVDFIRNKGKS